MTGTVFLVKSFPDEMWMSVITLSMAKTSSVLYSRQKSPSLYKDKVIRNFRTLKNCLPCVLNREGARHAIKCLEGLEGK